VLGGRVKPPALFEHMNTLLVVGSAPCLYTDVDTARELFPSAEVMTINDACGALPNIEHMLAGHTIKAEAFVAYRKEKFPNEPTPRVHASWHRVAEAPKTDYPSVTDWWSGDVVTGAASVGKAIRIGFKLGFDRVVLCGCPMNGGGYFNSHEVDRLQKPFYLYGKCARIGSDKQQNNRSIVRYRDKFATLAKTEWAGRVFSMSGWTKEVLGAPQ
jgi:hypothetical protein